MREWTDSQGRKIQAEYVGVEAGKVSMKLANGKLAAVPFAQLSEADQAWVKHRFENPPAPKPEPPKPSSKPTPTPRPKPNSKEIDWAPLKDGGMNVPNFDPIPDPGPDVLIPVADWIGKRYFYMRPDGTDAFPHLKIENRVAPFSDGLAYVKTKDQEGYINREGKWALGGDGGKPLPEGGKYYKPFAEGRARFQVDDHLAFIDTDGKVVGKRGVYLKGNDFSDGLAAVYEGEALGEQAWKFIDRDGNVAIPGPWHSAKSFASGVAWVSLDKEKLLDQMNGRKRLINTKGEPVFGDAVFLDDVSYRFVGGYGKAGGRVYRANGEVYLEEQNGYYLSNFADDGTVACVNVKGGAGVRLLHLPSKTLYGPLIKGVFTSRNFKEGIAPVLMQSSPEKRQGTNKWFAMDRTGRLITKEAFFDEPEFHEGHAVLRKDFGAEKQDIRVVVINRKGEIIYKGEPQK